MKAGAGKREWLLLPPWRHLPDVGLYMEQVITLMERTFDGVLPPGEITKSMVNNYVRAGLLKRPAGKRYDREQLAVLMEIAVLKQAMNIDSVGKMLLILNREGVEPGYVRFLAQVESLENALRMGEMRLPLREEETGGRALILGIAAAVCTIGMKMQIS